MAACTQVVTRIFNNGFSAQLNVASTQARTRPPSCSIEGHVAQNPPLTRLTRHIFERRAHIGQKGEKNFSPTWRSAKNRVATCMCACISSPHTAYSSALCVSGASEHFRANFSAVFRWATCGPKRPKLPLKLDIMPNVSSSELSNIAENLGIFCPRSGQKTSKMRISSSLGHGGEKVPCILRTICPE